MLRLRPLKVRLPKAAPLLVTRLPMLPLPALPLPLPTLLVRPLLQLPQTMAPPLPARQLLVQPRALRPVQEQQQAKAKAMWATPEIRVIPETLAMLVTPETLATRAMRVLVMLAPEMRAQAMVVVVQVAVVEMEVVAEMAAVDPL